MRVVFPYDGYEHIGIGYLAAQAISAGHEVRLSRVDIGDYIAGYRRPSDAHITRAVDRLLDAAPEVVAFSLASPFADTMARLATQLRRRHIRTIAGGPHASAEPRLTLETGAFDALITGQAETVFVEALEAVVGGATSVAGWLHTPDHPATSEVPLPDVNGLPFPAKDLFYALTPYLAKDYVVLSARGCPYRCAFCAMSGKATHFVQRAPESVLAELAWAKRRFRPQTVYFMDDVFGLNLQWLTAFLPRYQREIGLPFHAITHPRHLDFERAALLREAGCFAMRVGVQTLTPETRQRLGRPETDEDVSRAIAAARKHSIRIEVDHMVDLPGEALGDGRRAVQFYAAHPPDAIRVYWLMPLPGSRWFLEAQSAGRISRTLAEEMRRGRGFGRHSYLYWQKGYSDRSWFGTAVLLTYLPFMPRLLVRLLLGLRAERYVRVPSFAFLVGLSRLMHVLCGWDRVGALHLTRLFHRLRQH